MIPTYNEEENARPIYEAVRDEITKELPEYDYEILFIDNKSQDRTRQIIRDGGGNSEQIGGAPYFSLRGAGG